MFPAHLYLALINRRQERRLSLCLRHASHLGYISAVVAVGAIGRVINHEQITVAVAVASLILSLALAVAILWVAVET